MARSTQTTAARARGEAILDARGCMPRDMRSTRRAIAAGAIADLLHALGPADAIEALRGALDGYAGTLRTGRLFPADPTRDVLERARVALGGA